MLTGLCTGKCRKVTKKLEDDETTPLLRERAPTSKPQIKAEVKKHSWREVLNPQSVLILLAYTLMSVHTMAFESVLPVFLHTPVQHLQDNPDVQLPFKFVGGFGMGEYLAIRPLPYHNLTQYLQTPRESAFSTR